MTALPEVDKDTPPFRMVGDQSAAAACAGDVCELPAPAGPLPDEGPRD